MVLESVKACCQNNYAHDEIVALAIRESDIVLALKDLSADVGRITQPMRGSGLFFDVEYPSWPRPYLLPLPLCPRPIDEMLQWVPQHTGTSTDNGTFEDQSDPQSRYVQNANFGYRVASANDAQAALFERAWASRRYRLRCWIWFHWQSWVKDLWNFVKWPLAITTLLSGPAYYAYRLFEALSSAGID